MLRMFCDELMEFRGVVTKQATGCSFHFPCPYKWWLSRAAPALRSNMIRKTSGTMPEATLSGDDAESIHLL